LDTAVVYGAAPYTTIFAQPKLYMEVHENSTRVEAPDTTIPDVQVCLKRNDDDTSSNPTGRDISDNVNKGNNELQEANRNRYI